MSNLSNIKLYSYLRCPFAMRVRMVLHEKGIPFDTKEEDLRNFSEELKSMHPEAKVPLLVHGTKVIYESSVITEYIEEAFPKEPALMPKDAYERAEVRLWTYWCNQIFKPDLDRFKYGVSRFAEEDCVGAEGRLVQHLERLESRLKNSEWLVGDKFSLADIHVFPFVRQLSKVKPEPTFLVGCKSVNKWLEKILSRPAFSQVMEKK